MIVYALREDRNYNHWNDTKGENVLRLFAEKRIARIEALKIINKYIEEELDGAEYYNEKTSFLLDYFSDIADIVEIEVE